MSQTYDINNNYQNIWSYFDKTFNTIPGEKDMKQIILIFARQISGLLDISEGLLVCKSSVINFIIELLCHS
jgi:hypothetical protein